MNEDEISITIRDEFAVHLLNEKGKAAAFEIAASFSQFLSHIEAECSDLDSSASNTRELAIVRTKLQEAAFFAKRAIAVLPENQEPPR